MRNTLYLRDDKERNLIVELVSLSLSLSLSLFLCLFLSSSLSTSHRITLELVISLTHRNAIP